MNAPEGRIMHCPHCGWAVEATKEARKFHLEAPAGHPSMVPKDEVDCLGNKHKYRCREDDMIGRVVVAMAGVYR